ncbi:MAG TPA: PepSY domain-containing protein [Microlunatus sp.]|nr:PepSY domain-containing protein [Microlunatus sp.]
MTELDWSTGRWAVTVVDGKTTHEIDVSADGQKVLRRHTEVTDAEDYKLLQSVKHYMADAIQTATAKTPGDPAEVELESQGSKVVWELSIVKTDGGFANVYVDAVSGKIVR